MDYVYLFTQNQAYPDPLEEIAALAAIDQDGGSAYLLLNGRAHPPLSSAAPGDGVALATRTGGLWHVHGRGRIAAGGGRLPATPAGVAPLYGPHADRWWQPLADLELTAPRTPAEAGITVALPAAGQAGVINLRRPPRRRRAAVPRPAAAVTHGPPDHGDPASFLSPLPARRSVGVDLTAGTWASHLNDGPKPFPVVELVTGDDGVPHLGRVAGVSTLTEFVGTPWAVAADRVVVDGPCRTNGIPLRSPPAGWDFGRATPGYRLAEQNLARLGVGLFWTSLATLERFDGASRWIARSVHLFARPEMRDADRCLETHPHAVFVLLQRHLFGQALRPKTTPDGRGQRLHLLRLFVPDLDAGRLPTHDHVDAAAAALLGLIQLSGHATAVGDAAGGHIWVPAAP